MSNKANAPHEDDGLTEYILDFVDPEENDEPSAHSEVEPARGRQKIQEKWSRVVNINSASVENLRTFVLASDLLYASALPKSVADNHGVDWAPKQWEESP